ncbi:alpha/beta fold hydrolase [Chamaesiphon sp. VAR_48_metabat_403]|uniref:alpha/beta hydrolase n=1 Tax=Chamaesiphon sp. VAR_48_metabat_403 TaxID=2964700 RepID=UPI00286D9D41|nr:alpha/beta fold hydrolase [Chamaesiphon sp. VAR_48_metabat_403]
MRLLKKFKFSKKIRQQLVVLLLISFCLLNILAYMGAYKLTHFATSGSSGCGLPQPSSAKVPTTLGLEYVTQCIRVSQTEWLEAWSIPVPPSTTAKGTIILFPGNGGSKAKQLLAPARVFHSWGYDTLLVDFRGVGGSSGNTTTLGIREAEDVALSVEHLGKTHLQRPLILYGVSMGTAAILKAVADKNVHPDGIILELPFARLVDALRSRFRAVFIPTFPLAELTVFWGGIQHGFDGFAHNPVEDAKLVECPTLILHGKLDKWTTGAEIEQIFNNLRGAKQLSIFPDAGHALLVTVDLHRWTQDLKKFLKIVERSTSQFSALI